MCLNESLCVWAHKHEAYLKHNVISTPGEWNNIHFHVKETLQNWQGKTTPLRPQIYLKLQKSNDDLNDSRTKSLTYFCLICHIWWGISKDNFPFWVYRFVLIDVMKNVTDIVFFYKLLSRDPDGWSISNFYRFASVRIHGGLHEVLTLLGTDQ